MIHVDKEDGDGEDGVLDDDAPKILDGDVGDEVRDDPKDHQTHSNLLEKYEKVKLDLSLHKWYVEFDNFKTLYLIFVNLKDFGLRQQ